MPISGGKYVAPTWQNDGSPAIDATELQAISDTLVSSENELDDLSDEISTAISQISGKANVATGSYVGTGTYGSNNPCTLTFDFVPQVIFINPQGNESYRINPITRPIQYIYGLEYQTNSSYQTAFRVSLSYNETTVSWYSTDNASRQQNYSNTTYYYIAIG